MYCKFCKAPVHKGEEHCKNCGATLDSSSIIMPEKNKKAYCRYCGNKVSIKDSSCKKCGTVLNEYSIIYKNGQQSKYGKVLGGLICFFLVFAILIVAGYLILFRGNQTFQGSYFKIPYDKSSWFYKKGSNEEIFFYRVEDMLSSSFLVIDSASNSDINLESSKEREEWSNNLKRVLQSDVIQIKDSSEDFVSLKNAVYYLRFEYEQSGAKGHFYFLIDTSKDRMLLFKTFENSDASTFEQSFLKLLKEVSFS